MCKSYIGKPIGTACGATVHHRGRVTKPLKQNKQKFKVRQPQRAARSKRPNTPSDGSKNNGIHTTNTDVNREVVQLGVERYYRWINEPTWMGRDKTVRFSCTAAMAHFPCHKYIRLRETTAQPSAPGACSNRHMPCGLSISHTCHKHEICLLRALYMR